MKKPGPVKKTKKPETRQKAGKRRTNPVSSVLDDLDADTLESLRQMIAMATAEPQSDDALDLFDRHLDLCADTQSDPEQRQEVAELLTLALGELRVSANGGDPQARQTLQTIFESLDEALARGAMTPLDMIMTGKLLADAELAAPESLKRALVAAAAAAGPASGDHDFAAGLIATLMELAEQTDQNPFAVHSHMTSLLASFPSELIAQFLFELVGAKYTILAHATAGFVLHPDAELAGAATTALTAWSKQVALESLLIERLIRMRPWLAPTRQAQLDVTIRTLRANVLPPVEAGRPKLIKCRISVCDGSGGQGFVATQKVGSRYQIASVLLKSSGIADAMVLRDLKKPELDSLLAQMTAEIPTMEIDLTAAARMFALATARSLAAGAPPPFKFIEIAEQLGLGPITPDESSPLDVIEALLAPLPAAETNAAAVLKAHADESAQELQFQWFEAGKSIEDLLAPLKTRKQRIAKILTSYLPSRRAFWAGQCAFSALAMRSDKAHASQPWVSFALIGREIASGKALEKIPLMKMVAENTVVAFELRQ